MIVQPWKAVLLDCCSRVDMDIIVLSEGRNAMLAAATAVCTDGDVVTLQQRTSVMQITAYIVGKPQLCLYILVGRMNLGPCLRAVRVCCRMPCVVSLS